MTKSIYGVPAKVHNRREAKYIAVVEYKMACIAEKPCSVIERELENDVRAMYLLEMIGNEDMNRLMSIVHGMGEDITPELKVVPRFNLKEFDLRDTV